MLKRIKEELNKYDLFLLGVILSVVIFGSIMVISAGFYIAVERFGNENFFVTNQIKNVIAALAAFLIAMVINYRTYNSKYLIYFASGITILALVYLLISNHGQNVKGATRWIFGFQPSEVAKNMIIFFFAFSLNKMRTEIETFIKGYLYHFGILAIVVALVVVQPAFSTSMMIFLIGYSMFYVSGMKMKHLASSMILIIPVMILMAIFQPYRAERIKSFFNPSENTGGSGYQVHQSLISLGNGGITGSGLGESRQKEMYLPEPHNDFIFSIIGDELGFIGTFLLVLAYIYIILKGFMIASRAPDYFGFILASGITLSIFIYSVFNMGITLGLVPPTGLPLPLVSYGGTSLIMTMFSLGVLLNISYKSRSEGLV